MFNENSSIYNNQSSAAPTLSNGKSLIFIDSAVEDYQKLVSGVAAGIEVVVLNPAEDGIKQITAALQKLKAPPQKVYIIAHGSPGCLHLGNGELNLGNIGDRFEELQSWSPSHLFLYGCKVAAGDAGAEFIEKLHRATGAEIAASSTLIGSQNRGGNWELDVTTSSLVASLPIATETVQEYAHVLEDEVFEAGSYVIDMGQSVQTLENTIKAYGAIYELIVNENVPVKWAINPDKEVFGVDFTADGHDYRGGSFIIPEDLVTPAVEAIFAKPKYAEVKIDQITTEFEAPIYGDISTFPRAVLDLQNGGLAEPYFGNAGISEFVDELDPLGSPYIYGSPLDLDGCNDTYIVPHADPDGWEAAEKQALYDFITEDGGWLWAADHAVSAFEVTDIPDFGDRFDLNFLGYDGGIQYFKGDPTGAGLYGGHGGGTLPFSNNTTGFASDPIMQIMSLFDDATTNGSEQIYIPFKPSGAEGGWLPSTTVAIYDPDHPDALSFDGTNLQYAATVTSYGRAFGNEDYGKVMYTGGHSFAKGSDGPWIQAQRSFFNFILESGTDKEPEIAKGDGFDANFLPGDTKTFSATVSGDHTIIGYEWKTSDGTSIFANETMLVDPITGEVTISADFTLSSPSTTVTLLVNDACGRQSILSQVISDAPPTVDLDGDDSTVAVNDYVNPTEFTPGAPVGIADADVAVADNSETLASMTITLTNPLDGGDEFLAAGTLPAGITASAYNPSTGQIVLTPTTGTTAP